MSVVSSRNLDFCVICRNFVLTLRDSHRPAIDPKWRFGERHLNEIIESSQGGCRVYRFIESGFGLSPLDQCQDNYLDATLRWGTNYYIREGPQAWLRMPHLNSGRAGSTTREFELIDRNVISSDWPGDLGQWVPEEGNSPKWTSSPCLSRSAAFDLATKWLSMCSEHLFCRKDVSVQLPSRLIEVGTRDSPQLRLKITSQTELGRYAALSYCWGISNNFVTNSTTLSDRIQGFVLESLPRTIREAVIVTRELGIPFLWVDALCIIQGTDGAARHDWIKELGQMSNIYSNSAVTIYASGSADASGGLFHPTSCVVPYVYGGTSDGLSGNTEYGHISLVRTYGLEFDEEPTVEPRYKHTIGNRIRMLIREVCLCKGN
jgi:hypothetical protein